MNNEKLIAEFRKLVLEETGFTVEENPEMDRELYYFTKGYEIANDNGEQQNANR